MLLCCAPHHHKKERRAPLKFCQDANYPLSSSIGNKKSWSSSRSSSSKLAFSQACGSASTSLQDIRHPSPPLTLYATQVGPSSCPLPVEVKTSVKILEIQRFFYPYLPVWMGHSRPGPSPEKKNLAENFPREMAKKLVKSLFLASYPPSPF